MIDYLKSLLRVEIARPLDEHYSEKFPIKFIDPKKKYSFGNKNKNINFYVIKRKVQAGLFSNVAFVLDHIKFANKRKMIPIVDMENFYTVYNENKKINTTRNAWSYYFKPISRYKLDEVYKSRNVFFSSDDRLNKKEIDKEKSLVKIYKKYIHIIPKHLKEAKKIKKKIFNKNEKILGVHVRGTIQKITSAHHLPPKPDDILKVSYEVFKKKKCKKIFLVTEDIDYLNVFKKFYKKNLIYLNTPRSKCNMFGLHNEHFIKYSRKQHRYKLGKETIIDALLLSFLPIIIFSTSNVPFYSNVLSKKNKICYHLITEKNSYNKFFARWQWYLKLYLPIIFGKINFIIKNI